MYKINKRFIEIAESEGYDILSIGNPTNAVRSADKPWFFIDMEYNVMGWDLLK